MRLKFPIEAFMLSIIVFSGNMLEAMTAGILVIFTTVAAMVLKNALKDTVSLWSLRLCVLIAASAIYIATFDYSFYILQMEYQENLFVLPLIIGLFIGKFVLQEEGLRFNAMIYESSVCYGFFLFVAIGREVLSFGSIFEISFANFFFLSKSFQEIMFGFLAAGISLALTSRLMKKEIPEFQPLYILLPVVCAYPAFKIEGLPELISILTSICISTFLFLSVKKRLIFSGNGKSCHGLTLHLISMGFIYMILNAF